jgi:MraZ protein
MWYGEYFHSLDSKDRFVLPAKFREKFEQLEYKKFYMTRGLDGCLFIFSHDVWKNFEEKLRSLSFTKQQSRSFNRLYFSGAHEVEFDGQGRTVIPQHLKEFAKIQKDIVVIGVADRIEIWDKNRWGKFYADNKEKFEEIAEGLIE